MSKIRKWKHKLKDNQKKAEDYDIPAFLRRNNDNPVA